MVRRWYIAWLAVSVSLLCRFALAGAPTPVATPDRTAEDNARFHDLLFWLKRGGAQSVEITIETFSDDFRGVHTVSAIANRSLIMTIPRTHIMTDQNARQSAIGQAIAEAGYVPRNVQSLVASLLCEQREFMLAADQRRAAGEAAGKPLSDDEFAASAGFWAPYLRLLPRDYPTLPIFYTEDELSWLSGSAALQNIATLQTDVRSEFDQLQARVPAFRRFDYRTFLWARLAVMTRAFSVYINKAKLQAMIPLADMLNHHMLASKLVWGFKDEMDSFALTAAADYAAGDQLYLSYGSKSNTALLVDYGFVLADNPFQSAVIVMKLPYDSPLFNTKMLFFDDTTQYVRIFSQYSHKDTQTAFSVARFICGTSDELTPLLRSQKFKLADVTPLSASNEMCALKLIAESAAIKLRDYPRSLDDDLALLEHTNLTLNVRNCLHVTKSEKRALTQYVLLGTGVAPLLNMTWAELGHQQSLNRWVQFNEYISLVVVPLVFRASFGGRLSKALAKASIGLGHAKAPELPTATPTLDGRETAVAGGGEPPVEYVLAEPPPLSALLSDDSSPNDDLPLPLRSTAAAAARGQMDATTALTRKRKSDDSESRVGSALLALPIDVLEDVMAYVAPHDLLTAVARSCRALNGLVRADSIWLTQTQNWYSRLSHAAREYFDARILPAPDAGSKSNSAAAATATATATAAAVSAKVGGLIRRIDAPASYWGLSGYRAVYRHLSRCGYLFGHWASTSCAGRGLFVCVWFDAARKRLVGTEILPDTTDPATAIAATTATAATSATTASASADARADAAPAAAPGVPLPRCNREIFEIGFDERSGPTPARYLVEKRIEPPAAAGDDAGGDDGTAWDQFLRLAADFRFARVHRPAPSPLAAAAATVASFSANPATRPSVAAGSRPDEKATATVAATTTAVTAAAAPTVQTFDLRITRPVIPPDSGNSLVLYRPPFLSSDSDSFELSCPRTAPATAATAIDSKSTATAASVALAAAAATTAASTPATMPLHEYTQMSALEAYLNRRRLLPVPALRRLQSCSYPPTEPSSSYRFHRVQLAMHASGNAPSGGLLSAPPSDKHPLPGIYAAEYGPHGTELLYCYYETHPACFVGYKLLGDPNVPAGEVSFRVYLNDAEAATEMANVTLVNLPGAEREAVTFPVVQSCTGWGRIAENGFHNPRFMELVCHFLPGQTFTLDFLRFMPFRVWACTNRAYTTTAAAAKS